MLKTYNISLKASDNYITLYKNYQLSTQAVVNYTVSPENPKRLFNDGSKIFLFF